MAAREAKTKARGKRPGGRPPAPPTGGVCETDQINLPDEESRIMPRSGGGGFEQSYNAQAAVDTTSMLIVGARLSNAPADVRQLAPMLDQLAGIPHELGRTTDLLADAGFFGRANVERCLANATRPWIARRRTSITSRSSTVWPNRHRSTRRPGRSTGWFTTCRRRVAGPCTGCANKRLNRCLASSNR